MRRFARRNTSLGGYDQNMDKAAVIYILENDGLRFGWINIGCSSRSGATRPAELNKDANTGTPGVFRCVFELRTLDCGRAERLVFKELSSHRRGKWGQEFFEVELVHAQAIIRRVCFAVDDTAAPPPPSPPSPPPRPQAAPPVFPPASSPSLAAATPSMVPAPIPVSPIRLRWVPA